jgi:hypothetical protein
MDDAGGSPHPEFIRGDSGLRQAFCPGAHACGQRTASHQSMDLQGVVEAGAFFIDSGPVNRLLSLC